MASSLVRFGVSMAAPLVAQFDELIANQGYRTRSEAIRDLIRERLVQKEWERGDENVAGTLTLIYDHRVRGLTDRLTMAQHEHVGLIVATLHVHLDEHNCLEVLAMKGRASTLTQVSDRLLSSRGVKHGKLVLTSTGESLV